MLIDTEVQSPSELAQKIPKEATVKRLTESFDESGSKRKVLLVEQAELGRSRTVTLQTVRRRTSDSSTIEKIPRARRTFASEVIVLRSQRTRIRREKPFDS